MDFALYLLQWALILHGLLLVLIAANTYVIQRRFVPAASDAIATGDTYYVVPAFQHLMAGVTTGLIAMGLGAALFYLRRLYLRRFYGFKS